MTSGSRQQILRQRLLEVTDELHRDGWEVQVEPRGDILPAELRDLRPDLIATRGQEVLIGEVASRHSAAREQVDEMAKRLNRLPNVRFEVYWVGDVPDEVPPLESILTFINEARAVAEASPRAGLLLAFAALEGGIAHFASREGDVRDWRSPRQMLATLYSLGRIDESDFQRLSALYRLRSEIAHRAEPITPDQDDVAYVLAMAERMATDKYVSVDQMVEWFLAHYE